LIVAAAARAQRLIAVGALDRPSTVDFPKMNGRNIMQISYCWFDHVMTMLIIYYALVDFR
jgi:hypothetical protein